jgi:hypothetical protein
MPPAHLVPHIITHLVQHAMTPILASRYLGGPTRRCLRVESLCLDWRFGDTACATSLLVTTLATGTQVGEKVVVQRWIQWVMEMGLQLRNFNLFWDAGKGEVVVFERVGWRAGAGVRTGTGPATAFRWRLRKGWLGGVVVAVRFGEWCGSPGTQSGARGKRTAYTRQSVPVVVIQAEGWSGQGLIWHV